MRSGRRHPHQDLEGAFARQTTGDLRFPSVIEYIFIEFLLFRKLILPRWRYTG